MRSASWSASCDPDVYPEAVFESHAVASSLKGTSPVRYHQVRAPPIAVPTRKRNMSGKSPPPSVPAVAPAAPTRRLRQESRRLDSRLGILEVLTSSLYPPRCPLCGRDRPGACDTGACRGCLGRLLPLAPGCSRCAEPGPRDPCERCEWSPPAPDRVRSCLPYRARDTGCLLRTSIHAWKYRRDLCVGAALAALFVERSSEFPLDAEAIVPVPTLRRRIARRGIHHAAELARAVARSRGLPVVHALRRTGSSGTQTALGRAAREANVRGIFRIAGREPVDGRSVLLIDDVLTTGATTDECAHALRRAGARHVELWTLGRSVKD